METGGRKAFRISALCLVLWALFFEASLCRFLHIEEAQADDVPHLELKFGNYSALSFVPTERQFEYNIGASAARLEVAFGPISGDLQESRPFLVYARPHGYVPSSIDETDPMLVFPSWSGAINEKAGDDNSITLFYYFVQLNGTAPITNETDGDWVIGAQLTDTSIDTLGCRIGGVASNDEPSTDPPQAQGDLFPLIFVAPLYVIVLILVVLIGVLVYFLFTRHKKNHAALGELQDKMIKQGIMAAIGALIMVVAIVLPAISIALSFRYPTYTCCHYFPRPGAATPGALGDPRCFEGSKSDVCFFNQSQSQSVFLFVWYIWPWGGLLGLLAWTIGLGLVIFSALQFTRLLKAQHQGTPAVSFTVSHEF